MAAITAEEALLQDATLAERGLSATIQSGNSPTESAVAPDRARGQALQKFARAVDISVEVAAGARLMEIHSHWHDLIARADSANVFMHPIVLALAAGYPGRRCRTLLAWRNCDGDPRLVGVWAFAMERAILPVTTLTTPSFVHAYLATPVIDRECLDATLEAMIARIADHAALPKIIALNAIEEDGAVMQALARVLTARGSARCVLRRWKRRKLVSGPSAQSYMEKALSQQRREKLRQQRHQLAQKGSLESRVITELVAVNRALQDFLRIEAAGWKGRRNTALLCNPSDWIFAEKMVAALAAEGEAWIYALYLNGEPVSLQVVLQAGPAAFTWKATYDEGLRDFSPGMLLMEDYTAAFLSDDGIAYVDSCDDDDNGFTTAWCERQPMAQVWFDARRDSSAMFAALSRLQKAYLRLGAFAKAISFASLRRRTLRRSNDSRYALNK